MTGSHARRWAPWFLVALPTAGCTLDAGSSERASFRFAQQQHCAIDAEVVAETGGTSCGTDSGGASSSESSGDTSSTGTGLTATDESGGTGAGGTEAGGTDAGGTDAGGTDAGGTDAGGTDAGGTDAGGTDAGGTEAGGTDAGGTDAGGTDVGGTDAGGTDAGGTEAGGTEAGGTEAGGTDAGGTDAGGTDDGGSETGASDDSGSDDASSVDDGGGDDGGGDDGGGGGGGPVLKDFRIDVMSKSFIGPLSWGGLGAFPGPFWDAIGYAQFLVLAQATDISYSESPATGFQNTGDYRMWSDLYVSGKCEVGTGRIRIDGLAYPIGNPANAGWEPNIYQAGGQELGPVYGAMNPHTWFADTDDDGTGFTKITYSYVISGHPNNSLEIGFQAAAGRTRTDIWHKLTVELWCDDDGDVHIRWQSWRSGFPSLRTWVYSNGNTQLNTVKTAVQGPFSALWSLAPIPQP